MNSSFRKYGGLNYASSNNIVRNHYCNNDNLIISEKIGLLNSKILNESHIDMSGNSILGVKEIYFYNGSVFNGTSGGDLLSSNNTFTGSNTFNVIPTAPTPTPSGATSSQIATVGYVQSVIPSSSNSPTLTGPNSFSGTNTFTQYPTITAPTPTPSEATSSQIATVGYVQSVIPSSSNSPTLTGPNSFSGSNTFNGGLTIGNTTNSNSVLLNANALNANQLQVGGSIVANTYVSGTNLNANGGALNFNNTTCNYSLSFNTFGAVLTKGLTIGNITNPNTIQLSSDTTTNNQLDISGNLSVSGSIGFSETPTQPAQTYPITNNNNGSATIGYVNSASTQTQIGTANSSSVSEPVPFSYTFGGIPNVVFALQSPAPSLEYTYTITNITASGFTINQSTSNPFYQDTTFIWIAVYQP
jgi:hypothetical protein